MHRTQNKNIIVACDTFMTGGAETFALRMARYYRERGHNVWLFSVLGDKVDERLVRENAGEGIPVLSFKPHRLLNWLLYKIDGLRYRLGRYDTFRRKLTIRKCRQLIAANKIEAVHTNMFASLDIFNHALLGNNEVVTVHSVHADILGLAHAEVSGHPETIIPYYQFTLEHFIPVILARVNYVVATAEMHLKIFKAWPRLENQKLRKIYNPVDRKSIEPGKVDRAQLGIPEDAFVFGSMARCVPEKGWGELIAAFVQSALPDAWLLLIGDGPYLAELKQKYSNHTNILFVGNQPAPVPYLQLFDVGVSPSYFWESLPTAIIDYMSLEKPVICTDNAESRIMINGITGNAGIVVPLQKDEWEAISGPHPLKVDDMATALQQMYHQPELRAACARNGLACFEKFDKDLIVDQYMTLFG